MDYCLLIAYSRVVFNKTEIGKIVEMGQLEVISPAGIHSDKPLM